MSLWNKIKEKVWTWAKKAVLRPATVFALRVFARYYTVQADRYEKRLLFVRRRRVNANMRLAMFLAGKPLPPVYP